MCVSVRAYLRWDGGWLLWGVVSPREMQQIIKHAFLGCSFRIATSEHACSRVFNQLVCGYINAAFTDCRYTSKADFVSPVTSPR